MALYTMQEILKDANERHYGVGYFNTVNLEMVRSCIEAAEELRSPIIIGTAEALLTYSEFDWIAPIMLQAAREAKVPVAVHLDHTYRFDNILRALRAGFGSVMYDGSRATMQQNIEQSKRIADIAHAMGAGIECELGCVGGLSDENDKVDDNRYTEPDDAAQFVEKTGTDFLAVSIGTLHGVYTSEPVLDIDRLAKIRSLVDIPLVLHGGSGLSNSDLRDTIKNGISKINIYTDVVEAAKNAFAQNISQSFTEMLKAAEKEMKAVIIKKLDIIGSSGKA